MLAYQYLQMLPQIAKGDANKLWIVPSEMGKALEGLGGILGGMPGATSRRRTPDKPAALATRAQPTQPVS